MLIGFAGGIKAGKDTCYERIQELYGDEFEVTQLRYAENMKKSICGTLGITMEELEVAKRAKESHVTFEMDDLVLHMSFRDFIQRFGTEGHRDVFGIDFWVNQTLPLDYDHSGMKIVCVTDLRFPNEVQRVKDAGGIVVYLEHEDEDRTESEKKHASETLVTAKDADFVIDNYKRNDNFQSLDEQLQNIVDQELHVWATETLQYRV